MEWLHHMGIRGGRCVMPQERASMRRGTFVRAIDAPGPIYTTIVEVKVKGQTDKHRLEQEKQANAQAHRTLRLNAIRMLKEGG